MNQKHDLDFFQENIYTKLGIKQTHHWTMAPVLEGKAPIPAIATTGAGKGKRPGKVTLLNLLRTEGSSSEAWIAGQQWFFAWYGYFSMPRFKMGWKIFGCYLISKFLVNKLFQQVYSEFLERNIHQLFLSRSLWPFCLSAGTTGLLPALFVLGCLWRYRGSCTGGVVVFFDSRISKTGIHSSHQIMKKVTIQ